jgi:response regulator NasT
LSAPAQQCPIPLRILVSNERADRIGRLTEVVVALGHEVVVGSTDIAAIGALTVKARPDVALVGLGNSSEHALELIGRIVHEARCPVIALLEAKDMDFVHAAAERGIFAYLIDGDPDELEAALDIVLRRFAAYHALEGAFERRAVIERAKGILMERHGFDAERAFALIRDEARSTGRKVVDVADAVVSVHRMLPAVPDTSLSP